MQTALAIMAGSMVAGSVYLMLSRHLVRFIFGLVLASNAVNLLIFAAGRPDTASPPLIPDSAGVPVGLVANSLPQALILTAIVIGFALLAFVFILFFRAYETLGTVNSDTLAGTKKNDAVNQPSTERSPS